MTDPATSEQSKEERRDQHERRERRPAFDTSELNSIPRTTKDDPPYRNWWVVDATGR